MCLCFRFIIIIVVATVVARFPFAPFAVYCFNSILLFSSYPNSSWLLLPIPRRTCIYAPCGFQCSVNSVVVHLWTIYRHHKQQYAPQHNATKRAFVLKARQLAKETLLGGISQYFLTFVQMCKEIGRQQNITNNMYKRMQLLAQAVSYAVDVYE